MPDVIVTRDVLDIYDKYDSDFGLLDERWARQKDRDKLTSEQMLLFGEYVDKLVFLQVERLSPKLREATEKRVLELEEVIDKEVAEIIKQRVINKQII